MDQQSTKNRFIPGLHPNATVKKPAFLFVFSGKKLLIEDRNGVIGIPEEPSIAGWTNQNIFRRYLGEFDGYPCYCMQTEVKDPPSGEFTFADPRSLFSNGCDPALSALAGTANHYINWYRLNQFCGCCGSPMQDKSDERARHCPSCGYVVYPRISPAVIVAVKKDDAILLAHNKNFKNGMYSIVAGFVEPGETAEDSARREIFEETGIRVKNLRYFGSQPWPYPDSLMLAFTAEYESGEVKADGVEIAHAGWFKVGAMPPIPQTDSIAGRMIRAFIRENS